MKFQENSKRKYNQLRSSSSGEKYSLSNVISNDLMAKDLFISQEIILPNTRSSAPHFHRISEEIIYVLKGSVTAIEGNEEISLSVGDVILFESNAQKHHFLQNESNEECHVLVIRKKMTGSDVQY